MVGAMSTGCSKHLGVEGNQSWLLIFKTRVLGGAVGASNGDRSQEGSLVWGWEEKLKECWKHVHERSDYLVQHTHTHMHACIHTYIYHPHQQQLTARHGGPFIIFAVAFIMSNGHRSKITFPQMQRARAICPADFCCQWKVSQQR